MFVVHQDQTKLWIQVIKLFNLVFDLFPNNKKIKLSGLGNKAVACVLNDYIYLASGSGKTISLI